MKTTLIVDRDGVWLRDPTDLSLVGIAALSARLTTTLPLNKAQAVLLGPNGVITDAHSLALTDPDGGLVGTPAVVIHRYVAATVSPDTRGL